MKARTQPTHDEDFSIVTKMLKEPYKLTEWTKFYGSFVVGKEFLPLKEEIPCKYIDVEQQHRQ